MLLTSFEFSRGFPFARDFKGYGSFFLFVFFFSLSLKRNKPHNPSTVGETSPAKLCTPTHTFKVLAACVQTAQFAVVLEE